MKHLKNFSQWLFLGMGLFAFIFLLRWIVPSQTGQPVPVEPSSSATPNPYPPPIGSTPTPTATPITYPICQFPPQVPPEGNPVSNLDQFKFSDPQIVRNNEIVFGILDWTPNSEGLIYSVKHINQQDGTQSVELLNIKDNTSIVYGKAIDFWDFSSYGSALWIDSIQAIAYLQSAGNNKKYLTISNPYEQKIIPTPIAGVGFSRDLDGKLLLFYDNASSKLMSFDLKNDTEVSVSSRLEFPSPSVGFWKNYRISPRPNANQWVVYNNVGSYIIEIDSQKLCEINFGSRGKSKLWAEQIQWSPDGRYLAAIVTIGQPTVPFLDLMVVDTWTGNRWLLDLGGKFVSAFSWSPNSRNLIAIAGIVRQQSQEINTEEMILVDVMTQSNTRILPNFLFVSGTGYSGISWSPNGKIIAMDFKTNIPGTNNYRGQLSLVKVEGNDEVK